MRRWTWLLNPRPWHVGPRVLLLLRGTPPQMLHALAVGARPSTDRLELRDLFADGRRYQLAAHAHGFTLRTSRSDASRARRARTHALCTLVGTLGPHTPGTLRLQARARLRLLPTLRALAVPLFMTSVLLPMPWPPPLLAALVGALFVLGLGGHWLGATAEALDMAAFVEKVLEAYLLPDAPTLAAEVPLDAAAFAHAWDRYVAQQQHPPDATADGPPPYA